jgi:hypothetical protein
VLRLAVLRGVLAVTLVEMITLGLATLGAVSGASALLVLKGKAPPRGDRLK